MLEGTRAPKLTLTQQEEYRQFYLQTDKNRAKLGILILATPCIAFIANDYNFLGFSGLFWSFLTLRMGLLAVLAAEFSCIGKAQNYRFYDKTVLLSTAALMIGSGIINASRPENFIVQVIATCVSVFILYLVLPCRFSYQVLLSTTTSVGEALIIAIFLNPLDTATLVTVLVSLFFANIAAFFSAWQLNANRIKSYQYFVTRRKMEEELERHSKHLEELVAERTEKLKSAERLAAIGATAGMVGHDIRNPLTAITGAVYLAKKTLKDIPDGDPKNKLEERLDFIGEQTVYVNKIVADLQDYARPLTPKLEETDIEKLIRSILSLQKPPNGIAVELSVQKEFPKLKTDPTFLRRIIENLYNNAAQAMPDGGKLLITATHEKEKATIIVEDTGEGIPDEAKAKLFTPLFTTKAKGQGFGLAVVKKLTEGLGGTVTCESEVGKGTKFTVELPTKTSDLL